MSHKMYKFLIMCIIFVKYSQCCECDFKMSKGAPIPSNNLLMRFNSRQTVDKRQLSDNEYENSEFSNTSEKNDEDGVEFSEPNKKNRNTEFIVTEELLAMCPNFKPGLELNTEKMIDVWRVAFYRSSAELGCFKILLKNMRNETKQYLAEKYGDFNKTVNWEDCVLQLTNGKVSPTQEQTHFLQKIGDYSGLMSNIIITEEVNSKENVTLITLQDHSPDQWMVVNNLLLMRDCDNGDVIVFSRVPFNPSPSDVDDALDKFGEKNKEGIWGCKTQAILDNPRHKILS